MARQVYHAICVHHEARWTAFDVRIEAEVGTRVHDPGVVVLNDKAGAYTGLLLFPMGTVACHCPALRQNCPFDLTCDYVVRWHPVVHPLRAFNRCESVPTCPG